MYYIYLKCFDGSSGFFTHMILSTTGQEVGLHPAKAKAYKFTDRQAAFKTGMALKAKYACIQSFQIIP